MYMFNNIKYAVLLLLLVFLVCITAFQQNWLIVKTVDDKGVLLAPIPSDKEFFIRFTHSVALTPVDEFFGVDNGVIALKSTVYHDFGAGLPHMAEPGQSMIFEDGKIVISGFNLKIPVLYVRVGRIAKHALYIPNIFSDSFEKISLDKFVKPGQSLALSVQSMSFLQALIQGNVDIMCWNW